MLSPFLGFTQSDIVGTFKVASAAASGLAFMVSTADASPLTPTIYGNSFGTIVPANITTAGIQKETGYLLQPVTTSGPSVFSVLASIYDESVAAGANAALVLPKAGALIATDQYLATGTGAITFTGTVTLGTACGIAAGQPRTVQTGDAARLIFMGQVTQRLTACAMFMII